MKIKTLLSYLLLFFSLSLLIGASYSWFDNINRYPKLVLGSTRVNYFADGDGSETDPFIIAKPEHMFNLSYLQEFGLFANQQYFFKIANPQNGDPITIDFQGTDVPFIYQQINPVGNHIFPFNGAFDGNNSTLKSLTIDGTGQQDIGVFGYVGANSNIFDLFIDQPTIISNPSILDDKTEFHPHNDGIINRATGYIVGHLGIGAQISNVFVISPTINSLLNNDLNRSQYGLIGFNEADGGNISGGPREAYNFNLDANSAYQALTNAVNAYGNYYINGSSTFRLNDAIKNDIEIIGNSLNVNAPTNYSLSTLKISQNPNDPEPVFLYDQMVLDGYIIESQGSQYSRENIDLIGLATIQGAINSKTFRFRAYAKNITTPLINSQFIPTDYAATAILYVKPTGDPNFLGKVSGVYSGGGNLSYYKGFDNVGNYLPGTQTQTASFGASGVELNMTTSNAFAAVTKDANGIMTVVDPNITDPDYYVFVVGLTNGQSSVSSINFEYNPSQIDENVLTSIQNIDFINSPSDVLNLSLGEIYDFSYVNFGYELTENQKFAVNTNRNADGSFTINIDYEILDTSFFYFDIININSYNIDIYYDSVLIYSGNKNVIELVISTGNITFNDYDTGP
jgi:hypothetical protein